MISTEDRVDTYAHCTSETAQQRIAAMVADATGGHSFLNIARLTPIERPGFEPDPPLWAAHLTGYVDIMIDDIRPELLPASDPAFDIDAPIGVGETLEEALEALEDLIRRITWGALAINDGAAVRIVAYDPAPGALVIADELGGLSECIDDLDPEAAA